MKVVAKTVPHLNPSLITVLQVNLLVNHKWEAHVY